MTHKAISRTSPFYENMTHLVSVIIGLFSDSIETRWMRKNDAVIENSVDNTLDYLEQGKFISELDQLVNDNPCERNKHTPPVYFPNFIFPIYGARYFNLQNSKRNCSIATVDIEDDEYRIMEEIKYYKQLMVIDRT